MRTARALRVGLTQLQNVLCGPGGASDTTHDMTLRLKPIFKWQRAAFEILPTVGSQLALLKTSNKAQALWMAHPPNVSKQNGRGVQRVGRESLDLYAG
jgi:hypothetical protein